MEEPVLTVQQPFASAIFIAGKDVENRSQRTHYRGRLWIHAAKRPKRREWPAARRRGLWLPEEPLQRDLILGCVDLVDCVRNADSPWAVRGQYHWVLQRPMLLARPVAHKGQLGFAWRSPPRGQLVRARKSRGSILQRIFNKTDGRCHFCGDPLVFENRGWSDRPDGHWEVDHVTQRGKGGQNTFDNSLPACTMCNRLRWHRTGDAVRELLLMGLGAIDEVNAGTQIGDELAELRAMRLASNKRRRITPRTRSRTRRAR